MRFVALRLCQVLLLVQVATTGPQPQDPSFQNNPTGNQGEEFLNNQPPTGSNQFQGSPGFQNQGQPQFQNPGIQNPGFQNPGLQNPGFPNPGLQNPGIQNPGLQNPGFQNPGFQNPGFQNSGVQNPGVQNPGFQNPGFQFQNPNQPSSQFPLAPTAPSTSGTTNALQSLLLRQLLNSGVSTTSAATLSRPGVIDLSSSSALMRLSSERIPQAAGFGSDGLSVGKLSEFVLNGFRPPRDIAGNLSGIGDGVTAYQGTPLNELSTQAYLRSNPTLNSRTVRDQLDYLYPIGSGLILTAGTLGVGLVRSGVTGDPNYLQQFSQFRTIRQLLPSSSSNRSFSNSASNNWVKEAFDKKNDVLEKVLEFMGINVNKNKRRVILKVRQDGAVAGFDAALLQGLMAGNLGNSGSLAQAFVTQFQTNPTFLSSVISRLDPQLLQGLIQQIQVPGQMTFVTTAPVASFDQQQQFMFQSRQPQFTMTSFAQAAPSMMGPPPPQQSNINPPS